MRARFLHRIASTRILTAAIATALLLGVGAAFGLAHEPAQPTMHRTPQAALEQAIGEWRDGHMAEALLQFEVLARDGQLEAHYWLGRMLIEGDGAQVDQDAALRHLRLAAEAGVVPAQRYLGAYLLTQTVDGARDRAAGRQWLQRAALAGDREAALHLADLSKGDGPEGTTDPVAAYAWRCLTPGGQPNDASCSALADSLTPLQRHDAAALIQRADREVAAD